MIDVDYEFTTVRREVAERALEAGEGRIVRLSRSFPTTVDDLWEACTDARRLERWFLPVSGDLRVGGQYQLEGNAGGTVLTCEPPHSFTATWEYAGEVSWIEVRFEKDGADSARIVLEHLAPVNDHWAEFGPAATGIGWESGLLGLSAYLAGSPIDPDAFQAWATSAEAIRFTQLSGRDWGRAHEESGVPDAEPRAAAERAVTAYTQMAEGEER